MLVFEKLRPKYPKGFAQEYILRAKIPGGWLVLAWSDNGLCFVPDPHHEWDGNSLPLTKDRSNCDEDDG